VSKKIPKDLAIELAKAGSKAAKEVGLLSKKDSKK
jgi:hypothetical protein